MTAITRAGVLPAEAPDHVGDHRLALGRARTAATCRVDADRHHHLVGERQRAGEDVDMAVGDRIESAGIEGDLGHRPTRPVCPRGFFSPARRGGKERSTMDETETGPAARKCVVSIVNR